MADIVDAPHKRAHDPFLPCCHCTFGAGAEPFERDRPDTDPFTTQAMRMRLPVSLGLFLVMPAVLAFAPGPASARSCDGVDVAVANEQTICIKPGSGESFRDCPTCPEMVVVPSGQFMMGSRREDVERLSKIDDDWKRWAAYEAPRHRVTIAAPFAIGKFEITRDQFERFVGATGHNVGDSCWTLLKNGKWTVSKGKSFLDPGYRQSGRHPATCLSWKDAREYVKWLSWHTKMAYDLPTEAQWEAAARSRTNSRFSFGDDSDRQCAFANGADETARPAGYTGFAKGRANCSDGHWFTSPVGSFQPNGWGLHDVHGNLWEWVLDCWNNTYDGAPADGSVWLDGDCSRGVLRGGSWFNNPRILRSASRSKLDSGFRYSIFGFRVVRTLTP